MSIKKRLIIGIATLALLLNALAPMAFADTITVSGNGEESDNEVSVEAEKTTTVVQENTATINNNIKSIANSGNNEATSNTGGDVRIDTGNASSNVSASNFANLNVAKIDCDNCEGDVDYRISGNGEESDNEIDVDKESTTEVFQNNNADVKNAIFSYANSGKNEARGTTGGDVEITTGNAASDVHVFNAVNANWASVGFDEDEDNGSCVEISGNGEESDNEIDLDLERSVTVVQDNYALLNNYITSLANSGENEAKSNTGGDVEIDTGDAHAATWIKNLANFNFAEVGCCDFDLNARITGNGEESDNEIDLDLDSFTNIFQGDENSGNSLFLNNYVLTKADSGDNEVKGTTGFWCPWWNNHDNCDNHCDWWDNHDNCGKDHDDCDKKGDVEITTGNSHSETDVLNSGNVNIVSQNKEGTDFPFHLVFDFEGMMDMFDHLWLG